MAITTATVWIIGVIYPLTSCPRPSKWGPPNYWYPGLSFSDETRDLKTDGSRKFCPVAIPELMVLNPKPCGALSFFPFVPPRTPGRSPSSAALPCNLCIFRMTRDFEVRVEDPAPAVLHQGKAVAVLIARTVTVGAGIGRNALVTRDAVTTVCARYILR